MSKHFAAPRQTAAGVHHRREAKLPRDGGRHTASLAKHSIQSTGWKTAVPRHSSSPNHGGVCSASSTFRRASGLNLARLPFLLLRHASLQSVPFLIRVAARRCLGRDVRGQPSAAGVLGRLFELLLVFPLRQRQIHFSGGKPRAENKAGCVVGA